ncbi:MAG: RHS repeat domain-containing protein, partial [Bacteroidaceae bacterium]
YGLGTTTGEPLESKTFTYGNANWRDQLTAVNGVGITYDQIGNPLNDGTWTYTWEKGRQLKQMQSVDTNASFVYNENGLRVQKTVNGEVTNYTLHGKNIVHMTQGSNNLHFFYDANNKPAILDFNGTKYAYVHNLQDDIVAILDSNGTAVVQYKYDAWGKPISKTGSMKDSLGTLNPFRYRGYVYDEETELYYLRSRYYNPNWCRFLNKDIWLSTGVGLHGCNTFAYCSNCPVVFSDPYGKSPRKDVFQVCIQFEDNAYEHTLGEYINSIIPHEVKEREAAFWQAILFTPKTSADNAILPENDSHRGYPTNPHGTYSHKDVFPVCISFEDNHYEETLGAYINRLVPAEVNEPTMVFLRVYNTTLDSGGMGMVNSVRDYCTICLFSRQPITLTGIVSSVTIGFLVSGFWGGIHAIQEELN